MWRERCRHSTSTWSTFGAVGIGGIYFHANRAMQACVCWSQQLASTTTAILECNGGHVDVHPAVASLPVAAKTPPRLESDISQSELGRVYNQRWETTVGTNFGRTESPTSIHGRHFEENISKNNLSRTGGLSRIVSGYGVVERLRYETPPGLICCAILLTINLNNAQL